MPANTALRPLLLLLPLGLSVAVFPAQAATDATLLLPEVTVAEVAVSTATATTVPSATVKAEAIRDINAPTTETALKYQPELVLRSRYIGDNNALLSFRDANIMQTARTLVLADGMPLSNFLGAGWDFGPLWSLVAPEEIDRIKVFYGPFDARHSGNAMGGAVLLHTRLPQAFEARLKASWFEQHFSAQGESYALPGYQTSALLGDAHGAWHYRLVLNRLDSAGQPMSYGLARAGGPGGTHVSGARPYEGTWLVNAQSRTGTEDGLYKWVLGYDITPTLQARWQLAWQKTLREERHPHTFLVDALGNPVYAGNVTLQGAPWRVDAQKLALSDTERLQSGFSLQGDLNADWSTESSLSWFGVLKQQLRSSGVNYTSPADNGAGVLTEDKGSGWYNLDMQLARKGEGGWRGGRLQLGYHFDQYQLDVANYDVLHWRNPVPASLKGRSVGKTRTQAIFIQNEWPLADAWQLRLGVRQEKWLAFDGSTAKDVSGTRMVADYPERTENATSPKFELDYFLDDSWQFSLLVARAVRFPTLGELYQGGIDSAGNFTASFDPNLRAERSLNLDVGVTHFLPGGQWRVDIWQNRIHDSLFRQTNVYTGITSNQNIDRVVSEGVALMTQWQELGGLPLDVQANLAWTRPKIERDSAVPVAAGKDLPRVPRWRGSVFATYRFMETWRFSNGLRYSSDPYDALDNSDGSKRGFGYTDGFLVWDTKLRYERQRWSLAAGVNNLADVRHYAFHPYPGRTFFVEMEWHVE